jgi:hypothetical protein
VRRIVRRQHEDRLREVELAGDPLHVLARDPLGLRKDGERIAPERAVGEDVGGQIAVAHGAGG